MYAIRSYYAISQFRSPAPPAAVVDYAARTPGEMRIRPRLERPAAALEQFLRDFAGRVLISVDVITSYSIHYTKLYEKRLIATSLISAAILMSANAFSADDVAVSYNFV